VIIELPEQELGSLKLTPAQARIEMAAGLYAGRQVTLGRAARIAGIPYTEFMHELGRRGICINYTLEDALHDIETVEKRLAKR
jgi:predicted HTH domain antitoxin